MFPHANKLGVKWGKKLVEVCALDLFIEYVIIALKVFFAVCCYGVYFSCSSAFGLFLACEKAFLFQGVKHGVKGAVSEFYLEVCFYFLFDLVSP